MSINDVAFLTSDFFLQIYNNITLLVNVVGCYIWVGEFKKDIIILKQNKSSL